MKHLLVTAVVSLLAAGAPAATDWPGPDPMRPVGTADVLGDNLSGLVSDGPAGLWAVRDTGSLLHLERTGATWRSVGGDRPLRYPDGQGSPDAEGIATVAGDNGAVYVAAERNNAGNGGRNSILRFEHAGAGPMTATREWKLEPIIGLTPPNTGIESLTWIPDSVFAAIAFRTTTGKAYAPADYPDHGAGLFLTALESSGDIFVVALRGDGQVTEVGRISTGLKAVMDLSWNDARQELWATCDSHCDGQAAVLRPADGGFQIAAIVRPPAGMADLNNEGFAILPTCTSGVTLAVWSDDSATNGTALREASLPCQPVPTPASASATSTATAGATITAPITPSSALPTSAAAAPAASTTLSTAATGSALPSDQAAGGNRTIWYAGIGVLFLGAAAAFVLRLGSRRRTSGRT